MSSRSGISKNKLIRCFEESGFTMVTPCSRCARLKQPCVKVEGSSRCKGCVAEGGRSRCVDSKTSFSDSEWRRLVEAQNKIRIRKKEALALLSRLEKQDDLLRERAGDFIVRDIKEIEELEALEEEERKQKETEVQQAELNKALLAIPSSSSAHIDAALSPSAIDVSSFDQAAFDQFLAGIPESSQGS